jgi:EmrB/QacA subfamily drug resistance transporter
MQGPIGSEAPTAPGAIDGAIGAAGLAQERALLAVVALSTMLAPLNSTMIAVALPRIMAEFGAHATSAGWLVTSYLIVMAALQPVAGKLGDRLGRRPLILGGLLGFGLASLGSAFAPNLPALIALRSLQAIAGALALPNGAALLREVIPTARRGRSSGIVGSAVSLAAAAGPPLGGLLVGAAGWRAIFFVNLLLAFPALLLGWQAIPRHRRSPVRRQFDLAGALLLSGVLIGTAALLMLGTRLTDRSAIWASGAALAAGLVVFVRRELKHPDPVLQLLLFRNRAFAAANGAIALSNLAMYVTLLVLPVWLAEQAGWGSAAVGLVLVALSATSVVFAPVGGRLTDRYGRRWPAVAGIGLLGAGLLPLAQAAWAGTTPGAAALIGGLSLAGIGLGLSGAGLQLTAVETVGPSEAGVASGAFSTSRYLGSIVGSSALAAMLGPGHTVASYAAIFAMVIVAAIGATVVSLALRDWPST